MGVCLNQMNGHRKHFALIAQLARNKMSKKEYSHSDHMMVMRELLVLYQLKTETEQKILVATKENERLNGLLKKKEEDEVPF